MSRKNVEKFFFSTDVYMEGIGCSAQGIVFGASVQ